ncbi:MAG: hypothetical protein IJV48_08115 [Ruminococcus sp.]|nr:hypothetical protein [Ruminococcus sp.]
MTNNIRNNRYDRRATENARAVTKAKAKKQNIIIATVAVALVAVIAAGVLTIGALNAKPAIAQNASSVSMKADKAVQTAQKTTANALPTAAQSYNDSCDNVSYTQTAYVQTAQDDSQSTNTLTSEDRIDNIDGERVYIDTKRTAPEQTGTPLHYYANGKTSYGFDWDYDADNGNFVLSCNYNFDQQQYDFTFYGVTPGTANVTLYYFADDNVKVPVNMTINVDNDLNVTMG